MYQTPALQAVLKQAQKFARDAEQGLDTTHMLLSLLMLSNPAEPLLIRRQVTEESVLAHRQSPPPEPAQMTDTVLARAEQLSLERGHRQVSCLALLAAFAQLPESAAGVLLGRMGIDLARLSAEALSQPELSAPLLGREERARIGDQLSGYVRDTVEYSALDGDQRALLDEWVEPSEFAHVTTQQPRVHRTQPEGQPEVQPQSRARSSQDRRSSSPGRRRSDHLRHTPAPQQMPALADLPANDGQISASGEQISPFVLAKKRFPVLTELGRNLCHLAHLQKLDPVIGREREIVEAFDVLYKRRSNNPCFIGPPGVGKTALAEGLAQEIVRRHVPGEEPDRVIVQVDFGAILAGTHLRGALAERLRALVQEVRDAEGRVIVFIDEIHMLIGAGGGDGGHDAANELKAALARGEFPCVGATTLDEYRRHIEQDPALERRFTAIQVEPPDLEMTARIVAGLVDRYAAHHQVYYSPEALDAAVRLSRRYLHDRHDPDRSLSVLDLAGSVARREGTVVDRRAVAQVIARLGRVPVEHLLVDDPERFLELEQILGQRVIGQEHVLSAIGETIRRGVAGFAGGRPLGSFLFLGPTGVGKTQVVKTLAHFLFGRSDALTRLDMSEYAEAHSVSRLLGAPPGYVGYQEGGQLTDAIRRRPYQVLLFDEIEKAHREIWNLLLQLLEEGQITDGRGRTVDCSNILVVLTSNLGAELLVPQGRRIGFADSEGADLARTEKRVLEKARATLSPEIFNRIDLSLVFRPLSPETVCAVGQLLAQERAQILQAERQISFTLSDEVITHLVEHHNAFDPSLGARPMRRAIATAIESPIAEMVLSGELKPGDELLVDLDGDTLNFTIHERAPQAPGPLKGRS